MNKFDNKEVKKLIHSIGLKYGLVDKDVKNIVDSQFNFIKKSMSEISLSTMADEDLSEAKTNYLIRHIGKIYTTERRITNIKNKQNGKYYKRNSTGSNLEIEQES